ncbi:MAG: hypothetical protein ACXVAS_02660 [Vulcanimicrobiaceae bacterium]
MKRTHRLFEPICTAVNAEQIAAVARAGTLVAARFEPAIRQGAGAGFLDLVFAQAESLAILPLVYVDHAMLIEPEDEALVWPHRTTCAIGEDVLRDIETVVYPWLYARSVAHELDRECTRIFSQSFQELFEAARAAGFLAAAPYVQAIGDAAPAHHALRFAIQKRIGVAAPGVSSAARCLAVRAGYVAIDLCDREQNALANQWYGLDCFRTILPDERFDVWVSPQATTREAPVQIVTDGTPNGFDHVTPALVLPANAPVETAFGTRAQTARYRDPIIDTQSQAIGGSSGRIALSGRGSLLRVPDADTDDVIELARRLRAEGFTVDFVTSVDDLGPYDLVHVYGLLDAPEAMAVLETAHAAGKPTVVTASLEDVCAFGVWGTAVSQSLFATTLNEREIQEYLHHLATHALSTPEMKAGERHEPSAGFERLVRKAMGLAGVVLAASPVEEQLLRDRYGRRGPIRHAAPYLNMDVKREAIDALVGDGPFVLSHAPLEPRCNQLLIARAARETGLPIVFAGPVTDGAYAELVRESIGDGAVFMPAATPGQIAALYGRARVFIDAAWFGTGGHRIARAAAWGCALVVGTPRYAASNWSTGLWQVDPASVASIASGLSDAWSGAGTRVPNLSLDVTTSFVATVSAYADAQAARLNSSRA